MKRNLYLWDENFPKTKITSCILQMHSQKSVDILEEANI